MATVPDTYKPVPVEAAARIARECDKDVVVVTSIDDTHGLMHHTSYGKGTAEAKVRAARLCEAVAAAIDAAPPIQVNEDFRRESDFAAARLEVEKLKEELKTADRLATALSTARRMILNGIEVGYLPRPQPGGVEQQSLDEINSALAAYLTADRADCPLAREA